MSLTAFEATTLFLQTAHFIDIFFRAFGSDYFVICKMGGVLIQSPRPLPAAPSCFFFPPAPESKLSGLRVRLLRDLRDGVVLIQSPRPLPAASSGFFFPPAPESKLSGLRVRLLRDLRDGVVLIQSPCPLPAASSGFFFPPAPESKLSGLRK